MRKTILLLLFLIANYSFSQSVHDFKAVIIPLKYDFQKTDNQYRLQTISKMNLQKAGIQAYYSNETLPTEITDRCSLLYLNVLKDSGFLVTKLFVTFKDCYGNEIFKSDIGKSREKEFEAAYVEALNQAFLNVYALKYAYNGNANFSPKTGTTVQSLPAVVAPSTVNPPHPVVVIQPAVSVGVPGLQASVPKIEPILSAVDNGSLLYAQPTSYGYQLVDSEPKVVMKVYKTSNPASYMAKKGNIQGALVSKDHQWFFEYYQNDTLVSEKIDVKF